MKNWLIIMANGPKDLLGRVNHQYLTVYAGSEGEAKSMGEVATNHMQGYWTVWDVEPLE